ncbi:MAG: hypothetical protein LLF99_08190 [Desulfobacteraceae bacterium]|nr:hypothetical protein [Desulfobacteraceae bacterium]
MKSRFRDAVERFACVTVLAVFLAGCAGMEPSVRTAEQSPAGRGPVLPAHLQEKIRLSETLGEALYASAAMATLGAGVMTEKVGDAKAAGVCGTIVFSEGGGGAGGSGSWMVEFFTNLKDPRVAYQVRLVSAGAGDVKKEFKVFKPPRKPADGELLLHRAIRRAVEAIPDRPDQPVTPVVLPGVVLGEDGLLVYLLAGSSRDNVAVFGKHYRVLVSLDGQRAVKVEPLSGDVLETELGAPQQDGTRPFLYVTHLLGDYPLETHVFLNRLHRTDLYVLTDKYTWRIHDGAIQLDSVRK